MRAAKNAGKLRLEEVTGRRSRQGAGPDFARAAAGGRDAARPSVGAWGTPTLRSGAGKKGKDVPEPLGG